MDSYEKWLDSTPELNILYLMGLFDRPAYAGVLHTLRADPLISGLTDDLQNFSEAKWQYAIKHLRELRLLAAKEDASPDTLDCHPLVREHFGEQLQKNNPEARLEAHSRLYEYYKNLPEKEYPDTLAEMEPLFAAVAHGCLAGKHQEAMYDVYWERIDRKVEFYSTKKLGAFGADLAALSNFFEETWEKPAGGLADADQAVVLSWAGFRLRALGRLREAGGPMQSGLEMRIEQKNWIDSAKDAGNLSELYLTLGEVQQAVDYVRQSVDFADKSGDDFQREVMRTSLADALHQAGKPWEAEKLFRETEAMQQQRQPEYRYLYSLRGFQFCDLLLSRGQVQEVLERAEHGIEIARRENWLLDIALDTLSLGRAHFLQALAEGVDHSTELRTGFTQALEYLNQAVAGLREAGTQDELPRGLIARAALYRKAENFDAAWEDLTEAQEIAERGEMGLYLADYHLEACRLCLAEGKRSEAKKHFETAAERIEKMGYGRRKPEVEELRREIGA
jgi:tetratricopeptide (TPR) repeat protein